LVNSEKQKKEKRIMNTLAPNSPLEKFKQAANVLNNQSVKDWKENGGKVLGYFYSYIPDEIITAAGLLPFRIRATGGTGTEFSDAHFTQINCSFVRYGFDMVLQGELDFLDGVVSFNACDHLRRLYDNWEAIPDSPCFHLVIMPQKRGEAQTERYYKELQKLTRSIEKQFNVQITDQDLKDAIKFHNETRHLQRRLYQLRKKKNPPLTGAETMATMVAGFSMPKTQYNELLNELLDEIGDKECQDTPIARLMLVGGEIDDPKFIQVLESQGALVVTDMLWYGYRTCYVDVNETGDPLAALADYYLNVRPACPRTYGTSFERYELIKNIAKDYDVDGIVSARLLLCDQLAFEQDDLTRFTKKENIPHLRLEIEYVLSGVGQLKTRVQAFLETLKEV
jgi:bzd-type benzoyl-CoA reductase N subunit